ncbi:MAG TPA: HAMP domain-containing sensor histidine kinase, partial [Chryseosolibacter sp.]
FLQHKDGSEKQLHELKQETISDIRFSLNTIQKRTEGLLQFVDNYRKLTKVPKPSLEKIELKPFILTVTKLMEHEFVRRNVKLHLTLTDGVEINADPVLVEQVLINIITNGLHAVEHAQDPSIEIATSIIDRHAIIIISDNGKGIAAKELSEIFIPFFTTKKDGSGIGLSLSKQIMAVHGGAIKVKSQLNVGTSFWLHFNR